VFPEGINDPWPALSRGSPSTSNPISSSPRGKNSNLIIEEQCENSPQKRAKDKPPNATKIAVKCTVKSAPKKKRPKTHFIHAGLAQIDFEAEFAKVVKTHLEARHTD
jgi:hypothetical protein